MRRVDPGRPGGSNRLDYSLTQVERPGRYVGDERNIIRSNVQQDVRLCLVFPDLYELGISYYGFQILYHILNHINGVSCERAYLPWRDMQAFMQRRRTPLYGLESGRPLKEFDLIGVTLQTELHYPGVVKLLDLAGIPRLSDHRSEDDPLIIGGGPSAFHPEPVAPFFDAFLLGDGEEAFPEIVDLIRSSSYRTAVRQDRWQMLAGIEGVYVPGLYRPDPNDPRRIEPLDGMPKRVRARTVAVLKPEYYPDRPIIPFVRGEHDRLTIEIMRGCSRGCRFCQAGMIHRPVRERPVDQIVDQVMEGLRTTGWDEVGLLSLSTSDYSRLELLLGNLVDRLSGRRATLSFPSLRPTTFTEEIARIKTGGRRSTLTFAVEAGGQRMRDVINKDLREDDLLDAVERAYRHGWKAVKLYFMVGLPTEQPEDIDEGALLLKRLQRMVPRGRELHLSVAPFIPKPHSVFEGERFEDVTELLKRQNRLYRLIRGRWVKRSRHDSVRSEIEALLSRGDRRLAPVIAEVADNGDGFEAWGEGFSADRWYRALKRWLPQWRELLGEIKPDDPRPWDHLTKGITRRFMKEDLTAAFKAQTLADCRMIQLNRTDECYHCGLMKKCQEVEQLNSTTVPTVSSEIPLQRKPSPYNPIQSDKDGESGIPKHRYRVVFTKLGKARYLGHHDVMKAVERGLRRGGVSLVYSKGYSPRPKLSFGPALPLGYGAVRLWLEFESKTPLDCGVWLKKLRAVFPSGMRPSELIPIEKGGKKTLQELGARRYRLRFNRPFLVESESDGEDVVNFTPRTIDIDLMPPSQGGERPEDAWRSLIRIDSDDEDGAIELLAVTRID
ncbi:MAG: TIGR03960 family B12-binding radical SAM protein [Candidatus Electryoneaceae bacterium]|nr:TIGR03960 family B12-binding radical SAM protein [Candidatus Electryoneaceae bacterium]